MQDGDVKMTMVGHIAKRAILGDGEGKTLWEKYKESGKPRVDENLPLGIKIGSLVELDIETDFILGEGEFIIPHFSGKAQVFAFGEVDLGDDLKITRFYANLLDEPEKIFTIEIGTQANEIGSIHLYIMYDEMALVDTYSEPVTPKNEAALNWWVDGNPPILGDTGFEIFLEEGRNVVYHSNGGLMEEKEVIYDLPKDEELEYISHRVSYNYRQLENTAFGGRELCMVRLSKSGKTDFIFRNQNDYDSASIEIYVGVEITKTQIKIY